MKLSNGEKITEGVSYKIELTRAEEVADLGEHAFKEIFSLPHHFDMNNEKMKEELFEKVGNIMERKGCDTMIIHKETYEEFMYFKFKSEG